MKIVDGGKSQNHGELRVLTNQVSRWGRYHNGCYAPQKITTVVIKCQGDCFISQTEETYEL
jgi:hypothetical protein